MPSVSCIVFAATGIWPFLKPLVLLVALSAHGCRRYRPAAGRLPVEVTSLSDCNERPENLPLMRAVVVVLPSRLCASCRFHGRRLKFKFTKNGTKLDPGG